MDFQQAISEYFLDEEKTTLDQNKLSALGNMLASVKPEDLKTMEEHRLFINILGKYRTSLDKIMDLIGEKFKVWLTSLLSVGADGLYHDNLRFLFELIQNVDDCDYADPTNCKLEIHFDFNCGKITLKYNELGFKPEHVFSLTGIAESAKNISLEKIEIGEKGIGFKSVFGVADKVSIKSGLFSFELHEDNFMVPCEDYNGFNGVSGTELTIFLKTDCSDNLSEYDINRAKGCICRELYDKLVSEYCRKDALFNKNPILFLNKLTKIKLYYDSYDSLEFTVSKGNKKVILSDGLEREDDVIISSIMSSRKQYIEKQETSILCTRYTKSIMYDRNMCVSRYGKDTVFPEKKMFMQLVIPNSEFVSEVGNGSLYSFLPTQVKTTVPISCHIPFKLDSSRENVDNQNNNAWFNNSVKEFANMLQLAYLDLAKQIKNQVLYYVPKYKNYFFFIATGNDKLLPLKIDAYLGSEFLQNPIFFTEDNNFKSCKEVFSFSSNEEIKNPLFVYHLLNYNKELFVAPENFSIVAYGVEVLRDVYFELFLRAIQGQVKLKEALDVIDESETSYLKLYERLECKKIPYEVLNEISHHTKLMEAINKYALDRIKENKPINTEVQHSIIPLNITNLVPEEDFDLSLDEKISRYLKIRRYLYINAKLDNKPGYLLADNILVLSSENTLDSFAHFCRDVGINELFSANMTMRAASERLDKADDSLSTEDYMKLLHDVRSSIKNAFGKEHYKSYINVIKELNSDSQCFIRELLQNADDCDYADDVIPSFKLYINGKTFTTEYNELGFTKAHVRSITAIAESTKKKIHSGKLNEIGEKGIGFKTVFSVAKSVAIHSNDFHFKLSENTPTIPNIIKSTEKVSGTKMIFELRDDVEVGFSPEQVFSLCLCLRNLKDININDLKIHIEDNEKQRIIQINDRWYSFDKYVHSFSIDDEQALAERNNGNKEVSKEQEIVFYVPEKSIPKFTYYLYCGLPTSIELGVKFAINVPYELTASRDTVLQNKWNSILRQEMYIAYSRILPEIAKKMRIKVMQYIRFQSLQYGSQIKFSIFKNDEDGWLNNYNVIPLLKNCRFIPTYDKEYFAMPSENVYRYPSVIHEIISSEEFEVEEKRSIIERSDVDEEAVLKNLGCKQISWERIANLIVEYSRDFMDDQKFRSSLYKYLIETPELCKCNATLKRAQIIPVKGKQSTNAVDFVSYNEGKVYVDYTSESSSSDYNLLYTSILSKNDLERMLNVDIIVMDDMYKKALYEDKLKKIIQSPVSKSEKYKYLINELLNNREQLRNSKGVLQEYKEKIPLLMENGEYRCGNVFISSGGSGCFFGEIIPSHLVVDKAKRLAEMMECKDISTAIYEELDITSNLTADDIEAIKTLKYGYCILEQCMHDGYIDGELAEKYNLEGVKRIDYSADFDENDFPNAPVNDPMRLRNQISAQCETVRKIVKVKETRTVDKIQLPNGERQLIDNAEIRENTLKMYRPALNTDACFCQMCLAIKGTEYIEVNNIWPQPEYYWPQMRVALCLECSKKFKNMRQNIDIRERFYDEIKNANIQSDTAISIPIGNAEIRFTQTHLAEIQEILKSNKK